MINRKIDKRIADYYAEHKGALLITGARQIGKTYSIREYAKANYENFLDIDFISQPELVGLFDGANGAQDMLLRLSAVSDVPLVPGKTFVFFDEVQKYPDIVTMIKFLVEEGSYRYAMSGSLLGVELNDLRSEPVGYMDVFDMYPLDLEEFCRAVGVAPEVLEHLRACYESGQKIDEVVHKRMMRVFLLYLVVGGMPDAVSKYIETNNIRQVVEAQKAIIHLYKRDISQYDPDDKLYLDEIFDLIPSELNEKNKRFILKDLNENFKFGRFKNSFLWMKNAGVAIPVFNVDEPRYPLRLAEQRNLFKLFQNDVGLLACQYSNDVQIKLLRGEVNMNYGAVFENFAAQELLAHGFDLFYFNSKSQGEIDFVLQKGEKVLPVEIKSGKDYTRHSALDNVLSNEVYSIEKGIVFGSDNVNCEGRITYYPIYLLMFLENSSAPLPEQYKLDLFGIS